jgi:hypothetical protein
VSLELWCFDSSGFELFRLFLVNQVIFIEVILVFHMERNQGASLFCIYIKVKTGHAIKDVSSSRGRERSRNFVLRETFFALLVWIRVDTRNTGNCRRWHETRFRSKSSVDLLAGGINEFDFIAIKIAEWGFPSLIVVAGCIRICRVARHQSLIERLLLSNYLNLLLALNSTKIMVLSYKPALSHQIFLVEYKGSLEVCISENLKKSLSLLTLLDVENVLDLRENSDCGLLGRT